MTTSESISALSKDLEDQEKSPKIDLTDVTVVENKVSLNQTDLKEAITEFTDEQVESFKEIFTYIKDSKKEVRQIAVKILAGLSHDEHGIAVRMMSKFPDVYVEPLIEKLTDAPEIAALAWDALTNFSASNENISIFIISNHIDLIMAAVCSKDLVFSDAATKLLSNLTKYDHVLLNAKQMIPILAKLLRAGTSHNPHCTYDFVANSIADLTRTADGRTVILEGLETGTDLLSLLLLPELRKTSTGSNNLPSSRSNSLRRGGAASTIKNCLFDVEKHGLILDREEQIDSDGAFFLIAALAGRLLDVRSNISSEELENLPVELQLLERNSEPDVAIRAIIIESLILLGSTRRGRDCMHQKHIYPILREWHLLETNEDMQLLIERLVELLIRDEESA